MFPPERIVCLTEETVDALSPRRTGTHRRCLRLFTGIFAMIRTLGALVDATDRADALVTRLAARVDAVRERAQRLPRHPRVYFEEWDDPMISGIGWVSELIAATGGLEVFPQLAKRKNAKDRIVSPAQVISARPDIIIGSWCGKK